MKYQISKAVALKILLLLLASVFIYLIYINRVKLFDIVYPFTMSFFIAYLLNPLVSYMEDKGINRTAGVMLIFSIMLCGVSLLCFYILPSIIGDMSKLITIIPQYSQRFTAIVQYAQDKYSASWMPIGIRNVIDNTISRGQNIIILYIAAIIDRIILYLTRVFDFVLIPMILFYFLKDFKKITAKLPYLIPRKYRKQVVISFINIDRVFGNYIRSQIILSAIIAVLVSAALLFLKIDFALVIGILNGITNIIPYFGPVIGAVPAVIIALIQSPGKALYTIILFTIIQQVESDIISPKITGDSVDLHPVTVIFALIIGGEFFGASGLILGVPAAAAIKVLYKDIMKNLF